MKLESAGNWEEDLMFRCLLSENKLVFMGVYPVLYGWRVRAGFHFRSYMIDWCGGGDWSAVETLYNLCRRILEQRPEDLNCFDGLPVCSRRKPFYNDIPFVIQLGTAAGTFEPTPVQEISRNEYNRFRI